MVCAALDNPEVWERVTHGDATLFKSLVEFSIMYENHTNLCPNWSNTRGTERGGSVDLRGSGSVGLQGSIHFQSVVQSGLNQFPVCAGPDGLGHSVTSIKRL